MVDNPYSAPTTTSDPQPELATTRIRSVSRTFRWLGWILTILYVPIVVTCVVSLVLALLGHPVDSPLVLALASVFNGAILAVAILFILTGRRIAAGDYSVRGRALFLSCILMLGFPIFTVIGIFCFRYLKMYYAATAPDSAPSSHR